MKYTFKELIDVPKLQELTDELYIAASIPSAIIAMDGEILTGSGWQKICTDFHRKHPQIEKECIKSDTNIRTTLADGEPFAIYKCPRGLVDASSPVIIDGEHVANVFSGQVFLEPLDETTKQFFREQARKFGFDETEYIKAFKEVPIFTEKKFRAGISFLAKLAQLIADMGLTRLRELEAMETLRESEERHRKILENVLMGVYQVTLDGKFLFANQKMIEMFGYSSYEELGAIDSIAKLYARPLERPNIIDEINLKGLIAKEIEFRHKDGQIIWVKTHTQKTKNREGVIILEGIMEDVTEIKEMETQLQQAQKMEAIGTLTGGIAHDYNNLMSIIMGNLSLAQEETEPGSDLADFLNEANMASLKVRDLTHELMSLSRGGGPVREVGSLAKLLESVSELIPADSGISLTESISQDLKLVPYDRVKMGAVIRNVVKNAVEAMPDGGTLKIKAENLRVEDAKQDSCLILKPGDFVHISIQDQGKGIPKESLNKIFDPYFSTKAMGVQKGMGLGLATAYAIVQQHGGHIQIDSSPGAGTTVNIYLPAESQPEQMDSTITSADNKTSPVKRVLLMDDEESLRNLFQKMLEPLGYKVDTVKDGVEAIETYKKNMVSGAPFDAVILDLTNKGGMGGEQTMRELLKIDPDIKVIVSSGYFNDPVMADFEKYGFKGSLAKPYEKNALKEALETLFE